MNTTTRKQLVPRLVTGWRLNAWLARSFIIIHGDIILTPIHILKERRRLVSIQKTKTRRCIQIKTILDWARHESEMIIMEMLSKNRSWTNLVKLITNLKTSWKGIKKCQLSTNCIIKGTIFKYLLPWLPTMVFHKRINHKTTRLQTLWAEATMQFHVPSMQLHLIRLEYLL